MTDSAMALSFSGSVLWCLVGRKWWTRLRKEGTPGRESRDMHPGYDGSGKSTKSGRDSSARRPTFLSWRGVHLLSTSMNEGEGGQVSGTLSSCVTWIECSDIFSSWDCVIGEPEPWAIEGYALRQSQI